MRAVIAVLLALLSLLALSCDHQAEKTSATDATAMVVYEGSLTLSDSEKVVVSLAIDEEGPLANRSYRLTETYRKTSVEDSIYSRFGNYQVLKGNSTDSLATIYAIDTGLKYARYFIRLHADTLQTADANGNPILHPEPTYLIRKP